jgi:hypothetical protein
MLTKKEASSQLGFEGDTISGGRSSNQRNTTINMMPCLKPSRMISCKNCFERDALPFLRDQHDPGRTGNKECFETSRLLNILDSVVDIGSASYEWNLPALLEPTPIGPSARTVSNMHSFHSNGTSETDPILLQHQAGCFTCFGPNAGVDDQAASTVEGAAVWTLETRVSDYSDGIRNDPCHEIMSCSVNSCSSTKSVKPYDSYRGISGHQDTVEDKYREADGTSLCTGQRTLSFSVLPVANPSSTRTEMAATSPVTKTSSQRYRLYQTCQWEERFHEFLEFGRLHGHHLVPHTYPPNQKLALWVKRQRHQYKKKTMGYHSTLSDDRERRFLEAGFVFDSHKEVWLRRFQTLQKFHSVPGHCSVSSSIYHDEALSVWMKHQRRQYVLFKQLGPEKSTMTVERIRMLDSIGFDWNPRNQVKVCPIGIMSTPRRELSNEEN